MKFEIETYKGQLIEYDDDYDKFICDISIEDKWKTTKRLSLADVRKEIDTFIKVNADFKPFKVLSMDDYDRADFYILNVSAIRTDGRFVTYKEGNERYKSYSGKKDMKRWMIYNNEVVVKKKEMEDALQKLNSDYRQQIKELCKELIPADLSKYEHIINVE